MDLIAVSDEKFKLFEKKLFDRDHYRALAVAYERAYIREFGPLINKAYEAKIACIERKRVIAYCQRCVNKGQPIDASLLKEHAEKEMSTYREKLKGMVDDYRKAKSGFKTPASYALIVASLYKKIAKKIHPDVHPETARNKALLELWYRVATAYQNNNLKELEACEILLNVVLKQLGEDVAPVCVPDVDQRIQELEREINEILSTDPYQYKYLLEDATLVEEKKESLRREIEEYDAYKKQLDEIVASFHIYGE